MYGSLFFSETQDGSILVDFGPGLLLRNMVERYRWDDVKIISAEQAIESCKMNHPLDVRLDSCQTLLPTPSHRVSENSSDTGTRLRQVVDERRPPADSSAALLIILSDLFHYPSEGRILEESFSSIGIDSLGFIRLSARFEKATGKKLPASSYVSKKAICEILADLDLDLP